MFSPWASVWIPPLQYLQQPDCIGKSNLHLSSNRRQWHLNHSKGKKIRKCKYQKHLAWKIYIYIGWVKTLSIKVYRSFVKIVLNNVYKNMLWISFFSKRLFTRAKRLDVIFLTHSVSPLERRPWTMMKVRLDDLKCDNVDMSEKLKEIPVSISSLV